MNEVSKSQGVRLLDVFAFGPFMVYVGMKAGRLSDAERAGMILLGAGTILYNGYNWLMNRRQLEM